jgi:phosphoglucomutase
VTLRHIRFANVNERAVLGGGGGRRCYAGARANGRSGTAVGDTTSTHPGAGRPAPADTLVDVAFLRERYAAVAPDPAEGTQRVAFGTSGHRGTSPLGSFNDAHIAAIAQAVAEHRRERGIEGPLVLVADTHALSEPAFRTALEVFAGNGVRVVVPDDLGPVATPVVSHAILAHNGGRRGLAAARPPAEGWADGVVITPSHNPPGDGGFKYNPPHGGPADSDVTRGIESRANELLEQGPGDVVRIAYERALAADTTSRRDLHAPYARDLAAVLDLEAVRNAGVRIGADPMGGATLRTLEVVAEMHGLDLTITNDRVDPTFSFMTLDHDGAIRMDCSSPFAMASLIGLKDAFDVAFGSDPDGDRHGIVTRTSGLLAPNHYLAVAIDYLFGGRSDWPARSAVGKTLVSSSMIDRVADRLGRRVHEVPVGFKWFVDGLLSGDVAFGGEESAGASFLRRDGGVWTTDKDGILLGLLAAEMLAVAGEDPGERYAALEREFGSPSYRRVDAPATPEQKARLATLSAADVRTDTLAGDAVTAVLTTAPGNGAPIGGLKVVTEGGWFAARPSGTENVSKVYAESWGGEAHLARLLEEAQALVDQVTG